MHAFNWKNGFQRLHQKRILFYHAKGSHARSHHTHAHITRTLNHTLCFHFASRTFLLLFLPTLVVLLYRSWLQHWIALQLLDYTRAGMRRYSNSATDTYMRCTRIKFNCNMRVVRTYVKRNGPCTVHSASVRGPFNIRSKSVQ